MLPANVGISVVEIDVEEIESKSCDPCTMEKVVNIIDTVNTSSLSPDMIFS
jgi:hypothetical protein